MPSSELYCGVFRAKSVYALVVAASVVWEADSAPWPLVCSLPYVSSFARAADDMPVAITSGPLALVPPRLLNLLFPAYRFAVLALCFVYWALSLPMRTLLPHAKPASLQQGVVVSVNAGKGVPKKPVGRAFVTPLGLIGDNQRSELVASWGGHGEKTISQRWLGMSHLPLARRRANQSGVRV